MRANDVHNYCRCDASSSNTEIYSCYKLYAKWLRVYMEFLVSSHSSQPPCVEDRINKHSTLSVVTFSPVVASTRLTKNKVIRAKDLTAGASSNAVHGAGLQVH